MLHNIPRENIQIIPTNIPFCNVLFEFYISPQKYIYIDPNNMFCNPFDLFTIQQIYSENLPKIREKKSKHVSKFELTNVSCQFSNVMQPSNIIPKRYVPGTIQINNVCYLRKPNVSLDTNI
jgi:hypothetical protein